jgi:hypothetical protein
MAVEYLAAVFRKVAVRYVFMAEELVRLKRDPDAGSGQPRT